LGRHTFGEKRSVVNRLVYLSERHLQAGISRPPGHHRQRRSACIHCGDDQVALRAEWL